MKIEKISMVGFRGATAAVEIAFDTSKSVTLIFGENGTGKSTIADAFDFICNQSYGSLENYSLGGQVKKYVPSLGITPPNPTVTIISGTQTWVATLEKDGPVVSPANDCPDARILRRKNVQNLIEAQPKPRFEYFKDFIAVPNIEKSETALREAVDTTKKVFDESTRALGQAKDSLERLWTEEGKPSKSPGEWANLEANKDISKLQANVNEIKKLESAFQAADMSLNALDHEYDAEQKSRAVFDEAEQKQKAAELLQTQQSAELLNLLQDARTYIDNKQPLDQCPVCEQSIDSGGLLQRLRERINEMQELNKLVSATKAAYLDLQAKISVLQNATKDFCEKIKSLGLLLKSSTLSEVTTLKIDWDCYGDFFSYSEVCDIVEKQARELWSVAAASRQPLQVREEADSKSSNQHNAISGYVETLKEKHNQAKSLQALLAKLKAALDIVSKERKDYVEGILAKISYEVECLYTRLHPGEGIGKIRFFLKPKAIGSLEFDANFQNFTDLPPQAYYSESHLDTLGICVFLALAKFFKTDNTIVILDDVLTSVDGPHLERFMALLHDEAKQFSQVIVMTHYRLWRDRYRWARGTTANTQVIELGPWSLQNGLRTGEFLTAVAELRIIISQTQIERQSAASKAGIVLESLLDFITLKYRCKIPRNTRNEYTLGDLVGGVDSKLAEKLHCHRPATGGGKEEVPLRPLLDASTASDWIRNTVGCHFNPLGSEVSDHDVRSFCTNVLILADHMICSCNTLPTRKPSGSYWECHCGQLELHPLVYPGADPGRVDDEI